jgi:hypothetical protein
MTTDFPEGDSATIKLTGSPEKEISLMLRRPYWADTNFAISVNGDPMPPHMLVAPGPEPARRSGSGATARTSWFVTLQRQWKSGDEIKVTMPKKLRLEPLPDNPRRVAILWGPLVLAGDLGGENSHRNQSSRTNFVPVFVSAERPVAEWLKPVPGMPGNFRTAGVGQYRDVDFVPFYRLHRRTYGIYWDLYTPDEWQKRAAEIAAAEERQRQLETATVGYAQPGEMQAERDANMQGEDTEPLRLQGRPGRRGSKWFSFDLPVDPAESMTLVVTYNRDEWQERTFDVLVDGKSVGQQTIERRGPVQFFDVEYPIPGEILQGKRKVTVRFQAANGREIGAVFGIRIVRANALRTLGKSGS